MSIWNIDTLRELDSKYAEEGTSPHGRPLRAVIDILGRDILLDWDRNPEVLQILSTYERFYPEVDAIWPGMGVGMVAVVDQVRKVVMPVGYGQVSIVIWKDLGFDSEEAWKYWCREKPSFERSSEFAFADIFDLSYGIDDLRKSHSSGSELWCLAASNVSDFSNTLPGTFGVDTVVQPICLAVELSLKAALVAAGADRDSFRGRHGEGHDLVRLAERVAKEMPHPDDALVLQIAKEMPAYVGSRYKPVGLTRLQVVRLALGAQFIVASSVRRNSDRDLAAQVKSGWDLNARPSPLMSPD